MTDRTEDDEQLAISFCHGCGSPLEVWDDESAVYCHACLYSGAFGSDLG